MKPTPPLPTLLLVEPNFVLRRTIVAVAQDLAVAQFKESATGDLARPLLSSQRFDGVVMDLDGVKGAIDLLTRLRAGDFASDPDTAVVAMTSVDDDDDPRLAPLAPVAVLRKPFKVAELLQQVQRMPAGAVTP